MADFLSPPKLTLSSGTVGGKKRQFSRRRLRDRDRYMLTKARDFDQHSDELTHSDEVSARIAMST